MESHWKTALVLHLVFCVVNIKLTKFLCFPTIEKKITDKMMAMAIYFEGMVLGVH